MERINEQTNKLMNTLIVNDKQLEFLDQREVEIISDKVPRKYKRQKNHSKLEPTFYRFKLVVWFKNNYSNSKNHWFPSYDHYKNPSADVQSWTDEIRGYMKLQRLLKHEFKGKYKTAIIYMSLDKSPTTKSRSHNYPVDFYKKDVKRKLISGVKLIRFGFINKGANNYVNLESENLKFEITRYKREREIY